MKIRKAMLDDTMPMARVIVDTFLSSNRELMSEEAWLRRKQEWTYEVSAGNWKDLIEEIEAGKEPRSCIFVAENDAGEVVGFSYGCPSKDATDPMEVGEIDILYVREGDQRKGVGRALAQATAGDLARLGMTRLHICTPIDNVEGRVFYDRLGGQVIGTREDHEDGEVYVLVIYEWPDMQAFASGGR